MVRLQRVTFTALHQYLGLSAELVNQGLAKKKQSPFSGSPVRSRTRENFDLTPTDKTLDLLPQTPTQPVSINLKKPKHEWKVSEEAAPDMVPECDHHWSDSSHPGSRKRSAVDQPLIASVQDEAQLVQIATDAFVKELGLEDDSVLKDGKVQIREVAAGTYLMKEESNKDVALVYVLSGSLVISQRGSEGGRPGDSSDQVHMFSAHTGEIVGGLAVLTGQFLFFSQIKLKIRTNFFF